MRKQICMLLLAVMLAGTAGVNLAAETQNKVLFNESFDSYETGKAPSAAFTCIDKGNILQVADVPGDGDKSLKIGIRTTQDSHVDKTFSPALTGKLVFYMKVRIDNTMNSQKILFSLRNTKSQTLNILSVNKSGMLVDVGKKPIMPLAEGKFYSVSAVLDLDAGTYDVYVNNRRRGEGISIGITEARDISFMRFHVNEVSLPCNTEMYIDEVLIYEGDRPLDDAALEELKQEVPVDKNAPVTNEMIQKKMKDAVALYVGAHKAMVRGVTREIDENPAVVPVVVDGRTLLPVKFITEALGGRVTWDEAAQTAAISLAGKKISVTVGESAIQVDGESQPIDVPARVMNDRMYLPLRTLAELAGKKVFWDPTGIVVISDREDFFSWDNEQKLMSEVVGNMCYERPTGAEVMQRLKERNPGNQHPRLLATAQDFEDIKQRIQTDPTAGRWFQSARNVADGYLNQPATEYAIPDGIRLLSAVRNVLDRVERLSFVYRITGETKYADRAWLEIKAACDYKDWNPSHFLDTGEMMSAFAIGYDWLYDYLSDEQKALMRKNLVEKGFGPVQDDYFDRERTRTFKWSVAAQPNNWNAVCNGGALMAAMAVGDEEEEVSTIILNEGIKSFEQSLNLFAPDGAWFEGLSYWDYTVTYMTKCLASMDTALGTNYGLFSAPGIAQTGYFPTTMTGAGGMYNFHDCGAGRINAPEIFWMADKLGDKDLTALRLNTMEEQNWQGTFQDLLWYKGEPPTREVNLKRDWYFRDTEAVSMRSSWDDSNSMFAAFHAGRNDVPHSHLDTGSFVLDSFGTRFAMDLGSDDYNLPGGVWNRYRYRAEGHNTLVINHSTAPDQSPSGRTVIDRFETNDVSALATIDMTPVYSGAKSVVRGMKMTDNRNMLIVQDEVKNNTPVDIWWFMHTQQDIEISEDGKTAVLSNLDNKLVVKILSDVDGVFTVMDAQPMEGSPVIEGQNPNTGIRKLAIHVQNTTDMTLSVGFKGMFEGDDMPDNFPAVTPIDSWALDDPDSVPKPADMPKLTDLKVDGQTINFFDPVKTLYELELAPGEYRIPEVTAEGAGEIEITYPERLPGNIRVTVKNEKARNIYKIHISTPPVIGTVPGTTELKIAAVEASAVPQPENGKENSLDNDLNTRWSAEAPCWIQYDLGVTRTVDYVGLAFYLGDQRVTTFEIQSSKDGENWESLYSGGSGGKTLEPEIYNVGGVEARYIRIRGFGTTQGIWTSITEFKAYEKAGEALSAAPATLVMALYDKQTSELREVRLVEKREGETSLSASLTVPPDAENYKVQAFVVSDTATLAPYREKAVLQ